MRVALIESTHWHVPLYLDALERSAVEVVGISNSVGLTGSVLAAQFNCRHYTSRAELLDRQGIDFAFVFGRHTDMPAIAQDLLARNIPFAIEKPCGIRALDVDCLADDAERAGVYVSVPFILRLSDTLKIIEEFEGVGSSGVHHASFQFVAGSPARYTKAGVPWLLDPVLAGGGPLMNVGVHFIDLFWLLAKDDIVSVSAVATSRVHGLPIEDFISVHMRTKSGRVGTIECGYTFPSDRRKQREFTISVRSASAYYLSEGDGILVRSGEGAALDSRVEPARLETDGYYGAFVDRTLQEVKAGLRPVAGLRDAARCVRIVEAAYASARQGGIPIAIAVEGAQV